MYNKVLSGILIVLLIAITGTLCYFGYGYFSKIKKEKDAENYLDNEFETIIVSVKNEVENQVDNPDEGNVTQNNNVKQNGGSTTNTQDNGYYKGYRVAGKLEMPTIGKKFPILDEAEYAKAIEVSVLKIYGPDLNTQGNVVIAGHNYNNGTFFSKNKNLNIGDKIYITDLTGKRVEYTIYSKYYTPESDNTFFNRDTQGKTEVTLYTCDTTGKNRLIVCARAE